jgi:hypothetical protein
VGRRVINYGWAGLMNLELIAGSDSYNFRHYEAYFDLLQGTPETTAGGARVWTDFLSLRRPDILDALNVKYIVSSVRLRLPADRFPLVAEFRDQPAFVLGDGLIRENLFVFENRSFLPRVFWTPRVVGVTDEKGMIEAARHADLRGTAVVLNPGDGTPPAAPDPQDRASLRVARAGSLTVSTSSAARRYLVVSEVWHPGWYATVDAAPVELHRTDVALMGLWVAPGAHEVQLTFRPVGWTFGLTTACVCAGLLATLLCFAAWMARPSLGVKDPPHGCPNHQSPGETG